MNNPTLDNPQTVMHVLGFKAALPILITLFMPDCPRPASVSWLCRRSGVQSSKTARESLAYLEELRITRRSTINTKDYWQLTDGAYQLPLPLASLEASSQSLLAASSQSRLPSSSQSADGASSQLPLLDESSQFHQHSQRPGSHEERGKIYRASSYDDDVVIISDPGDQHHHHTDKHEAGKIYRATEASLLLERLGCDPPMPEKFAHVEAAVALAFYWSALPWAHTPIGVLRRRLEQGHEPPADHLDLARFWLSLDSDGRDDFRAQFDHAMLPVHRISDLVNEFDLTQAAAELAVQLRGLKAFEEAG